MNSFLVEAGRTENQDPEEILYVKLNQERKEKFRLLTRIVRENGEVRAEKEAMVPQAEEFVEKLEKTGTESTGSDKYKNLPCRQKTERSLIRSLLEKLFTRKSQSLPRKKILKRSRPFLKNSIRNFRGSSDCGLQDRRVPRGIW